MSSMVWYISKHTKTLSLINFKVKISINLIIGRPVLLYDGSKTLTAVAPLETRFRKTQSASWALGV